MYKHWAYLKAMRKSQIFVGNRTHGTQIGTTLSTLIANVSKTMWIFLY